MVDTNKKDLEDLKSQLEKLEADKTLAEPELFVEYRWLNNLFKNKISPVLLGKLEDPTEEDKFETSLEYDNYLKKSLV